LFKRDSKNICKKNLRFQINTVKMNMLYLIKKNCGNRLQAILLIKFNKLELSNN